MHERRYDLTDFEWLTKSPLLLEQAERRRARVTARCSKASIGGFELVLQGLTSRSVMTRPLSDAIATHREPDHMQRH